MTDKDEAQAALQKLAIKPGETFTHYKVGGTYEVATLAVKEDTLEPLVVYKSLESDSVWVRTYENFTEEIESKGQKVKRFTLVAES